MNNAKILVAFCGGQTRDGVHGCNYMIGHYYDNDGIDNELYAEVIVPNELDENEAEDYGLNELMDDIIYQAKEVGITEDQLIFQ